MRTGMGNMWLAVARWARSMRSMRKGGDVTGSFWAWSPALGNRCIAAVCKDSGVAAAVSGIGVVVFSLVVVIFVSLWAVCVAGLFTGYWGAVWSAPWRI